MHRSKSLSFTCTMYMNTIREDNFALSPDSFPQFSSLYRAIDLGSDDHARVEYLLLKVCFQEILDIHTANVNTSFFISFQFGCMKKALQKRRRRWRYYSQLTQNDRTYSNENPCQPIEYVTICCWQATSCSASVTFLQSAQFTDCFFFLDHTAVTILKLFWLVTPQQLSWKS